MLNTTIPAQTPIPDLGALGALENTVRLAADCLVMRADPVAAGANPFYYHRLTAQLSAVADLAASAADDAIRDTARRLTDAPSSPAAYRAFCAAVETATRRRPQVTSELLDTSLQALASSRIGHRLGDRYGAHDPVTVADLVALARPAPRPGGDPQVLVVIPFRDRTPEAARLRNLLACLRALQDQSLGRGDYRVCVVESDTEPRWRETIAPVVDDYVFAAKPGTFNKSWTVNVGVAQVAAPLLCILDADALVDRDFLARNTERFARPGTGAFLPFRDLSYLDAASSDRAIAARCMQGEADVSPSELRSFVVYRSPGVCVWLRRDVFTAVRGMDERYEGWGGEDMAFVMRLNLATPFLIFDDAMYHLYHESAGHLVEGQTVNADVRWLDWRPDYPIGDPTRFARPRAR